MPRTRDTDDATSLVVPSEGPVLVSVLFLERSARSRGPSAGEGDPELVPLCIARPLTPQRGASAPPSCGRGKAHPCGSEVACCGAIACLPGTECRSHYCNLVTLEISWT